MQSFNEDGLLTTVRFTLQNFSFGTKVDEFIHSGKNEILTCKGINIGMKTGMTWPVNALAQPGRAVPRLARPQPGTTLGLIKHEHGLCPPRIGSAPSPQTLSRGMHLK